MRWGVGPIYPFLLEVVLYSAGRVGYSQKSRYLTGLGIGILRTKVTRVVTFGNLR